MGGWGSGGWNSTNRPLREQTTPLDVLKVWRAGGLQPGKSLHWTWTFPSGHVSHVNQLGLGDNTGIQLHFHYCRPCGGTSEVRQTITVQWSSCRLGGGRPWWTCPHCQSRRGVVYGWRGRFACRECHQIRYASQHENHVCRRLRRAEKLRLRLGGDQRLGSITTRPRGMHHRTFQNLTGQIYQAESEFFLWAAWFMTKHP